MKPYLILGFLFTVTFGHWLDDASRPMARNFVDRFRKSINARNHPVKRGLLEPGFTFRGCDYVRDKERFAWELGEIRKAIFSVDFLTSEDQGDTIRIRMNMYGWTIDRDETIEVILHKEDQQLVSGRVASCAVPRVASEMAQNFVERFSKSVKSKKDSLAAGLLQTTFTFKGCKEIHDKEDTIDKIHVMSAFIFSVDYKSCEDLDENIRITVEMKGLTIGRTDTVEVILNKYDQQLVSGRTLSC